MDQSTDVARAEADLEDFFENATVGLHIVSADGIVLKANKAELQMLGYTAGEYIGQPIAKFHADQPIVDDILARLGRGEKIDRCPARLRAKDGSIRHVRITSSALFRGGKFIQTRCFTTDVTDRVSAEQRLHQILDALPAAVYTTDADGYVTYFNKQAAELAGREPRIGIDQWCVTWRLRNDDGTPLPLEHCPMAIALKESRPVRGIVAWAVRPDGSQVPFMPFPTPLYDESGKLVGAINMLVDMTERKRAEETQGLLLNELNHRVKNTLAIVQALAHQTMRRASSPNDFVANFSGRLDALARAHSLLSQESWKWAEFSKLVRDELLLGGESDNRISLSGPPVLLEPQQALNVALIVHELATNARKYGALSGPDGDLNVNWSVKDNGGRLLHLQWIEASALEVKKPSASGFGGSFIQQIARAHDGHAHVSYEQNGVHWKIELVLHPGSDIADRVKDTKHSGFDGHRETPEPAIGSSATASRSFPDDQP
jgi:PAS domain S-box-containing protein